MIIRKNILPKGLHDIAGTSFLSFAIPVIYWFEIFIVLPEIYGFGSTSHIVHGAIGTFLLINIVGNFFGIVLCDTSIRHVIIQPKDEKLNDGAWRLCTICESIAPPRSWHCKRCNICILKRDHHCGFTGCCIGHKNHRYFMMMLLYLFIATAYANVFNNWFIWIILDTEIFSLFSVLKVFFPLAMLMVDQTSKQLYLLVYVLSMFGMVFTLVLFVYHMMYILEGRTVHEKKRIYDLGKMDNIRLVFGNRWYITWILPFIDSPLPHNGIDFNQTIEETSKGK